MQFFRFAVIFLLLTFLLLTIAGQARAHEVRPAYLQIKQISSETYDLTSRVPVGGEKRLNLYVQLPDNCESSGGVRAWQQGGIRVEQWTTQCSAGLANRSISIAGLSKTLTDVLVRYERLDGTIQLSRLTPSNSSISISDSESWRDLMLSYGVLGVEHILLGIDHLLFVLALLLILSNWRKLVTTITAFTVAHSITLALATLGVLNVPQAPVEAVIALSILFVAAEVVRWKQGKEGITRRKPWLVAFLFGLLHGLGFAGALNEIGLPGHAIPLALLFFNLGVELGQLLFIAAVLVANRMLGRLPLPLWAWRVPVYSIGGLAAFWTLDRIVVFLVLA